MPETEAQAASAPMFNAPLGAVILCGGLLAIHAGLMAWPGVRIWALSEFALVPAFVSQEPLRLILYAFLHGDWAHVWLNSLAGLAFGTAVARWSNSWRMWALFLIICVLVAVLYSAMNPGAVRGAIGASGGVAGLFGAASRVLGVRRESGQILPLFSRPVMTLAASWLILNLILGVFGRVIFGADIAWDMHVTGYAFGLFLCRFVMKP